MQLRLHLPLPFAAILVRFTQNRSHCNLASFRGAPDVDSLLLGGRGFTRARRPGALLLVVVLPTGLDAKEGAVAKARSAVATANQKPGWPLAGGSKAEALQIWRERGLALLLLVCSLFGSLSEESLKPCARDVRKSRH